MSLWTPLRGLQVSRSLSKPSIPRPLSLRTLSTTTTSARLRLITNPITSAPRLITTTPTTNPPTYISTLKNTYSTSSKPPADQIIDELQELYEVAKDEFEIATESTDSATIYAASDRESARDALNELIAVYTVYTRDMSFVSHSPQGQVDVDTGLDPGSIGDEVREQVRKRVGTRVREIVGAVENLEERASAE
ncbi:hypothetical protein CBS63078_4456 [Aspergillus niger]|uniref:Uncharacterized protein n=2 Tax=Aspergillus niger TaxID=5061 RepID=G3YG13_ASPNA|nr:hypothetical protein ASPNIDRAFT_52788 [Aspergillus niger ATCC 1015]KAI2873177.1 hypothetical protein CBS11852_10791 [Aspergillus niger]KAI2877588.1 hypothetical protein CBS13152_9381 [Aspergillus niger]KAI2909341.1 hypothetical protein CBS63078_4456 [Aspergillus niger]KAI2970079.1 hypothetical protein CBS147323_3689 [Aspergillus niger]